VPQETPASPRGEETPALPRGEETPPSPHRHTYINLHVHRANGDLVVECMVPFRGYVDSFLDDLDDTGLVPEPSEEIDDPPDVLYVEWSGETCSMEPNGYVDELVWDGMILYWNRQFGYYVDNYGMSVSEPVHVTLVRTSARTLYYASRAN